MRVIDWITIAVSFLIPFLIILVYVLVKEFVSFRSYHHQDKDQPSDYEIDNETHLGDRTDWFANDGIDYRTKAFCLGTGGLSRRKQ